MKQIIDINNWNRKEHFYFFKSFDEPFHGIVSNVKCTKAYLDSKSNGDSFFLYYLHKVLVSINFIDSFKLRVEGDELVKYDTINVSPTIGRKDNSFSFSYIDFNHDFEVFKINGINAIEKVYNSQGLGLSDNTDRNDVIHFSAIPWVKFTGLSHARKYDTNDFVPKISVGKLTERYNEYYLPVSVHAHHSVVDGYDVGLFLQKLEVELTH